MHKKLESGLEVDSIGRCTGSFCDSAAALAVTLLLHDGGKSKHTYGMCQKHVDERYLSAEEYAKHRDRWGDSTLGRSVYERDDYEIRPLTVQEAAEVAYEQAAPERWEAEGRIGAFRRIVEMYQCEEIEGVLVDAWTAQIVVQVYDAVNSENQEKMRTLPVDKVCYVAVKIANR